MHVASRCLAIALAFFAGVSPSVLMAQANAPVIRSFSVDQVPQLVPGTELVFRATGTPGGTLSLRIDGAAGLITVPEGKPGTYDGAVTISIKDKITYASRVNATLKVGERQTTTLLAQTLLSEPAQAAAVAAANPAPVIARIETRNSGALTGGHELGFMVNGTAGGKASVSLDAGKTSVALAEEKPGQYAGSYTIKTRDQFTDATPVNVSLALGDKKAAAVKPLAAGALVPVAAAAPALVAGAKCDVCGVVESVKKVKIKGKPNYAGAIIGGVAGGALGNQVGKGDGNTAATVIGAVGGAVAGREIEKQVRSKNVYDVAVKMADASVRTVRFEAEPVFKVGAKVKLSGDTLVANE